MNICSLTVLPFMSFGDDETYPGIGADFEQSFETRRGLPADIFLASHSSFFALTRKRRDSAVAADPVAPFVDPGGYRAFIDRAESRFREALAADR